MGKFEVSYQKTLGYEGVYSLLDSDRGGETWMGISRRFHPEWEGWTLIDSEKHNVAINIIGARLSINSSLLSLTHKFYYETFFKKIRLDEIEQQPLCDELFDTSVNQGCYAAVLYLQKALNLLNNNELYFLDIKEDGQLGNNTLAAINAYMLSRSLSNNIGILLKAINGFQFEKYAGICKKDPSQEVNFYGWLKRV